MDVPIWTLGARDNVILDVISQAFALTHDQMQTEILGAHTHTIDLLARKDVDYRRLRNALTPQRDKHELALLFDSAATGNTGWYGLPVFERVLAALPAKPFSCSLLCGDLLIDDQDLGFTLLAEGVRCHRDVRELRHTSELFAIYVNNLSRTRAEQLRRQLEPWEAYVGYVDCTTSSRTKDWLSTTLLNEYVKHDRVFVGAHEDDVDEAEDRNLPGWPLAEAGYRLVSIPAMYFDLFLAYKIERRVIPGETDTRHGLTAISTSPADLDEFRVLITDDKKLGYVTGHAGGLAVAGLADVTRAELEQVIRDRLSHSYLYNLESTVHEGGTTNKFNVMLELPATSGELMRFLASLEYQPASRTLRLITLY